MSLTPDELRKYITKELNQSSIVPSGHRGAFVTYVDDSGVRTAIAFKADNGWEVGGNIGYHPHQNGLDYGVTVMRSW